MNRRLLASYLALTLVVLAALEIPLGIVNARNERKDLTTKVERDAVAMASLVEDALQERRVPHTSLQTLARRYAATTGARTVIVDRRGIAIADSHPTVAGERFFSTRPEIGSALRGNVATGVRRSHTLGAGLLYVAVPIASNGAVLGAVRITYPTSHLDARVRRYWLALAAVAAAVLAAVALAGWLLARSVVRPLQEVEAAAQRIGGGELDARAPARSGPPEVQALARTLNETAARLEVLLRSQEDFVADASHQLRTPLTALRLRLENLERDVASEGREGLERALAEVERLSCLVDELLALARAESGGAPATPLDLSSLAEERADAWRALAAERGVTIDVRTDGNVSARAAATRVEQVLDNLLSNALEVAPRGSTIEVAAVREGDWAELHVRDDGPGLALEQRERAFDRFWSGSGGSGLGLAIAQRLANVDDGAVDLRPRDGHGIDAVVRLPTPA